MNKLFSRTDVGGISLSRMIMGTNWMLGWSHTSAAADKMIRDKFDSESKIIPMLETFLNSGVDTIMAPFSASSMLVRAIRETQERTGKEIIIVDTPMIDVVNSADARKSAKESIQQSAANGAKICLLHHSCGEKLVNRIDGTIDRIDDYTSMIREAGMVPGMSAHMPEIITFSDENGYDIETYIQIFNCMGFMMQVEIETVAAIIHSAKKPVMTIKPMAAGRCTPYVGLNFAWNTIRSCDMVTVGCNSEDEAAEDIEISMAALERRFPVIEKRSSPNTSQAAFGKI